MAIECASFRLIRFRGLLAPNARRRPKVILNVLPGSIAEWVITATPHDLLLGPSVRFTFEPLLPSRSRHGITGFGEKDAR